MKWLRLLFVFMILFPAVLWAQEQTVTPSSGFVYKDSLAHFPLENLSGKLKTVNASELIHVLVFLSPECPLCVNYTRTLNSIALKFDGAVKFTGIVPGRTYSPRDVKRFINSYDLLIETYRDPTMKFSRYMNATITPEVIVIDTSGAIRYQGAIDDWIISLGRKKEKPTIFYLENALNELVNNKSVQIPFTQAKGCFINDY